MDSFLWLMFLSFSMLSGSFLAGNIPLAFNFSEERLRLVSTFGSGMLVGTALIVIIPEGVETLYAVQMKSGTVKREESSSTVSRQRGWKKAAAGATAASKQHGLEARGSKGLWSDGWPLAKGYEDHASFNVERRQHDPDHSHVVPEDTNLDEPIIKKPSDLGTSPKSPPLLSKPHAHSSFEAHRYIGPALAIGFAFMFLIDNLSHMGHGHKGGSHIVTVNDFRDVGPHKDSKMAATIGLVVHAAADGIALGAASASDRTSLELIVFLAIMLHKAPSAFGLAIFLLSEGFSRRVVRQHLLVFSLAAPIAAMFTYLFLRKSGAGEAEGMQGWTGILLLFSAGTFLYVATVHILPEIYATSKTRTGGGSGGGHEKKLSVIQILCLLAGIFAPLLLAVEHTH